MKLRNKLLTVLPIATIGALSPVVISSCSCGNSYSISYGDKINCKEQDNKEIAYHSVDSVKEAALNHIQFFEQQSLTDDQLKKWGNDNLEFFYWDLVYSEAMVGGFTLTWSGNVEAFTGSFNGTQFTELKYAFNGENKVTIVGSGIDVVSQCYKDCTKA